MFGFVENGIKRLTIEKTSTPQSVKDLNKSEKSKDDRSHRSKSRKKKDKRKSKRERNERPESSRSTSKGRVLYDKDLHISFKCELCQKNFKQHDEVCSKAPDQFHKYGKLLHYACLNSALEQLKINTEDVIKPGNVKFIKKLVKDR